jgi:hypothetical protein
VTDREEKIREFCRKVPKNERKGIFFFVLQGALIEKIVN